MECEVHSWEFENLEVVRESNNSTVLKITCPDCGEECVLKGVWK